MTTRIKLRRAPEPRTPNGDTADLWYDEVSDTIRYKKPDGSTNHLVESTAATTITGPLATGVSTQAAAVVVDFTDTPTPGTSGEVDIGLSIPVGYIPTRVWFETLTPLNGTLINTGDPSASVPWAGVTEEFAQSFPVVSPFVLNSVKMYLGNPSAATGNVYVDMYAADVDGKPTGPSLATSDAMDASSLFVDPLLTSDVTFTFPTPPTLPAGNCAIVLNSPDLTDVLNVGTGSYADGERNTSEDTGSTWGSDTGDLMFQVFPKSLGTPFFRFPIPGSPGVNFVVFTFADTTIPSVNGIILGNAPTSLSPSTGGPITLQDSGYPVMLGSFRLTVEYIAGVPEATV